MELTAHNGYFRNEDVNVLRVRPGVTVEQVAKASKGNNLDEILIQTDKGKVLVYADELNIKRYDGLPPVGEDVNFQNLNVKGKVLFVDDERNEEWTTAAVTAGVAVPVGAAIGFFGIGGIGAKVGMTDAFKLALGGAAVGGTAAAVAAPKLAKALKAVKEDDALLKLLAN